MKKATDIKIKAKDGKEIPVVIDDQPRPGGAYMDAVERGVLSKIDDIVARAWLTREVRTIDPNDPHGEGKLIAKAGAVTHEQVAAMRAALEGAWTRIGDDLILPPIPDALGFMRRANADLITNQMRTEMLNVAAKMLDEMPEEDSAPLSAWINDSRIENFREWLLGKGGWDKAIAERRPLQDELGRCFAGMPAGATESVNLANIQGDEMIEWPIKYRAIQLAGSRTAPPAAPRRRAARRRGRPAARPARDRSAGGGRAWPGPRPVGRGIPPRGAASSSARPSPAAPRPSRARPCPGRARRLRRTAAAARWWNSRMMPSPESMLPA